MTFTPDAAIDLLQRAGSAVRVESAADLVVDGVPVEVKVRTRPTPSDLSRELSRWRARDLAGKLAYVVPRAAQSLLEVAAEHPAVILIGIDDATVVIDGRVLRFSDASGVQPEASAARVAWGRLALMRALLRTPERRTQHQLAVEAGITQAAVSKGLREIGDVANDARGGSRAAAERLWARFLDEYPGARGIRSYWYSLDPPTRQAEAVQGVHAETLVSGDTGADRLAPWRVVGSAAVYARTGIDLAGLGFAEAGRDDATLTLIVPADPTLWATATAWAVDRSVPTSTADPLIVAHDIGRTGGSDVGEAVERLHDLVFEPWHR